MRLQLPAAGMVVAPSLFVVVKSRMLLLAACYKLKESLPTFMSQTNDEEVWIHNTATLRKRQQSGRIYISSIAFHPPSTPPGWPRSNSVCCEVGRGAPITATSAPPTRATPAHLDCCIPGGRRTYRRSRSRRCLPGTDGQLAQEPQAPIPTWPLWLESHWRESRVRSQPQGSGPQTRHPVFSRTPVTRPA